MKKVIDPKAAIQEVFGAAPVQPKKAKKEKTEKTEVEFESDFATLVNVAIVESALKGVKDSLSEQYKEFALEIFCETIKESPKQPETFRAFNGDATGSFQFRKSGSGFGQEIADLLDEKEIPYEKEVKTGEQFVINPEILANQELLGRLAVALKAIKEFEGIQIVQKVEAVTKNQFTDATIHGIVKNFDESEQKRIFGEISTLAFADPKLAGLNHKDQSCVSTALQNLANANVLKWSPEKKK